MAISRKLLEILVCPVSKQPLAVLEPARLKKVNAAIARGTLQQLDGTFLTEPLKQVLVTQNGSTLYRVDGEVPVLLEEQSIPCAQIANW